LESGFQAPRGYDRAREEKVISKADVRKTLEKMVEEGWYCGVRTFSEIVNTIEEVGESDATMLDRGGGFEWVEVQFLRRSRLSSRFKRL
jgi:hypothetical protein